MVIVLQTVLYAFLFLLGKPKVFLFFFLHFIAIHALTVMDT